MAPMPEAAYRTTLEVQRRPLKPYDPRSAVVEVKVTVRRLETPPVRDVATNKLIEVGPATDDGAAWRAWRRKHADRRYAVAKRALSRHELRRHGLSNGGPDDAPEASRSRPVRPSREGS